MSGIQTINSTSALVLNFTGGEYDIVSWDPRGVGSLTVCVYNSIFYARSEMTRTSPATAQETFSALMVSTTTTRSGTGRSSSTASR